MRHRLFATAFIVLVLGCGKTDKRNPARNAPHVPAFGTPQPSGRTQPMAGTIARLNISGRDGTGELQQICAGLSQEEAVVLGLSVLFTGADYYAVRVRLTNTGNVPIRVYPQNLRIHYANEFVPATSLPHPRFLQAGVLQPGFYFEGLVIYRARVDVGAEMRLFGGGITYNDPTILVVYD